MSVNTDLRNQLIGQMVEFINVNQTPTKDCAVIMARNGLFEMRRNFLAECITPITDGNKTSFLDKDLKEGISFLLPKMPYDVFNFILAFFKKITKTNNSEVYVQVFYIPQDSTYKLPEDGKVFELNTHRWFVYVPEQAVTAGSVRYVRNLELDNALKHIMDIHSHNSMNAFFSGTDDRDEQDMKIYGVIGRIGTNPEYKFRLGMYNVNLDIWDVFVKPETQEIDVADSLIDKVKSGLSPGSLPAENFPIGAGYQYMRHYMTSDDYSDLPLWAEAANRQFLAIPKTDNKSLPGSVSKTGLAKNGKSKSNSSFTRSKLNQNVEIDRVALINDICSEARAGKMLTLTSPITDDEYIIIPSCRMNRGSVHEMTKWLCDLGYGEHMLEALQEYEYDKSTGVDDQDFDTEQVEYVVRPIV